MSATENTQEVLNALLERLGKFLQTETVVGQPIQIGTLTLVPVISVSFCLLGGGEGGSSNDKCNDGPRIGAGMGTKISPNAVIIIKGEDVSVIPLVHKTGLEKIFEIMPEVISKINFQENNGE